jgi:hypothetical protein
MLCRSLLDGILLGFRELSVLGMYMGPDDPFAREGWMKESDQLYWLYGYDTENIEAML